MFTGPPVIIETDLLIRSMGQISESGMVKNTVKHLFLVEIFILQSKSPKYETTKNNFELSYTISNGWAHILSMLVSVSINQQ